MGDVNQIVIRVVTIYMLKSDQDNKDTKPKPPTIYIAGTLDNVILINP